jgi:succinoglycan biosynthesis protein ExoA
VRTLDADNPVVTVVVPMRNELGWVDACLDGFASQTWPRSLLEVVVVDGGSTDGSRAVVDDWASRHSWVRVVENPRRKASAAFNIGVTEASGEVVCLFSAHGVPDPTYVERSVAVLRETGVAGVGGDYRHEGSDPTASAIGVAMVSPFGMGSPHRFVRRRTDVDTISHPAYVRSAMEEVGPFDERLERNSDYEFNYRVRAAGGRLLADPSIGSVYRPRGSLSALGRQFWWYGRWKARVIRRHPRSVRPRHLVAPSAVAAVAAAPIIWGSPRGRRMILSATFLYLVADVAAVRSARHAAPDADPWVAAASFPVMHACWGAGFLASIIEDVVKS